MNNKNINLSFLIVWAAKSGTTFLSNCLNNHPDIFLPSTELRFFSDVKNINGCMSDVFLKTFIRRIDDYNHLFTWTKKNILWEKSPCYLYYYKESINNIKKYFWEDIKIIILLRNPVERAFSQYKHSLKYGYENISFEDALKLEAQRKKDNWYYIFFHKEVGLYYESVKAYKENFKNVRVYTFDDLKGNQASVLWDIYDFLWVRDFKLDTTSIDKHEGAIYKHNLDRLFLDVKNSEYLYNLFNLYINKYKSLISPKIFDFLLKKEYFLDFIDKYRENEKRIDIYMNDEIKKELLTYYTDDIIKTQKLVNIDLNWWLK